METKERSLVNAYFLFPDCGSCYTITSRPVAVVFLPLVVWWQDCHIRTIQYGLSLVDKDALGVDVCTFYDTSHKGHNTTPDDEPQNEVEFYKMGFCTKVPCSITEMAVSGLSDDDIRNMQNIRF